MRGVVVDITVMVMGIRKFSHAIFTYALPILLPLCFFWFDYLDQRSELLKGRNWWGDDPCFQNIDIHSSQKISSLIIIFLSYCFLSSIAFFYFHKKKARNYWFIIFISFIIAGRSTTYYWCWI